MNKGNYSTLCGTLARRLLYSMAGSFLQLLKRRDINPVGALKKMKAVPEKVKDAKLKQ
jgi:hypothetical protein